MRNNKGFTLVELLATIAIIGIMSGIAVMSVSRILNNAKQKYYSSLRSTIISASKSYYGDHRTLLPAKKNEGREIPIQTLIKYKYLSEVVDYSKKKCDYNDTKIKVTRISADKYTYEVQLSCPGIKD